MPWKLEYYLDTRGHNPVEAFIESLPLDERAALRARISFLGEIGNRAREPLSKSLGGGLFELRAKPVASFIVLSRAEGLCYSMVS